MINVGIIGAGFIVPSFIESTRMVKGFRYVGIASRNEEKLMSLCQKARGNGCEACHDALDLRQREQLDALCIKLRERFPSVSYLFCNAGKSIHRTIGDAIDLDNITASMKDGVLRLTLPKIKEPEPRRIEVKALSIVNTLIQ